MGAAGRDFHNFNVAYRRNESSEVIAFTATQIPYISGRLYPPELAGPLYPDGIPIYDESEMDSLVRGQGVDQVVFAYSDVSHEHVMHAASAAIAAGADFTLLGPKATMIESRLPVVAVCAVRTGSGKSQTTRAVGRALESFGMKTAVIRHPMPYGDLTKQIAQRFGSSSDLTEANCTIEEREEYEPHIREGRTVFAGIDYAEILRRAEEEADVILWDGGNNDLPFFVPDVHIVVADPLRAGHERAYHPGEANLRMADVVVINKIDSAEDAQVEQVLKSISDLNPGAKVVKAESVVTVESSDQIDGKRVIVVEDGPTLTHGDMTYGAGVVAAKRYGAAEIIDPRPFAAASIKEVFDKYPVGPVVPAMGYSPQQIADLEKTINGAGADLVLIATPIDLRALVKLDAPALRVGYELSEIGTPTIKEILAPIASGASRRS